MKIDLRCCISYCTISNTFVLAYLGLIIIDFGTCFFIVYSKLGLDLVPRCGAEMVDPSTMSVVELYHVVSILYGLGLMRAPCPSLPFPKNLFVRKIFILNQTNWRKFHSKQKFSIYPPPPHNTNSD